jgi:hypothetical protein
MDNETRFWIAPQVADNKNTADVRPLLQAGKAVTGTRPNTLISDGALNFKIAYNKEYFKEHKDKAHQPYQVSGRPQ